MFRLSLYFVIFQLLLACDMGSYDFKLTQPGAIAIEVNSIHSSIVGTSSIIADGVSVSLITITLRDINNNPVVGTIPDFSATDTGSTNEYGACSATDGSGVSTCTLTSTKAEIKTLSIVTPISKSDGTVVFIPGAFDADASTFTLSAATVVSGSSITMSVTPKDADGNVITGVVTFGAAGGVSTGTISATSGPTAGIYTATFTGILTGAATTITAAVGGSPITQTRTVTVTAGAFDAVASTFTLSAATVASGSAITMSVTPKDAAGNATTGTVTFGAAGGTSTGTISATSGPTAGIYAATFTGNIAGTATTITASVDGVVITQTRTVSVMGGALNLLNSTFTVSASTVPSGSTITLSVTPKDTAGNVITGVVTFGTAGGTSTGTFSAVSGPSSGVYSATFTGVLAGTSISIVALVDGTPIVQTRTVIVTAGSLSASTSTFTVSSLNIVNGFTSTLSVTPKDAAGNVITGAITFAAAGGTSVGIISATAGPTAGVYTATFTGTSAGTATTITASINGTPITQTRTITVSSTAAFSPGLSNFVLGSDLFIGFKATLIVTPRDAAGRTIQGTVTFTAAGGTSTGTIGAVSGPDANGVYTAMFTGTGAGTATTITARINGVAITQTRSITVSSFIAGGIFAGVVGGVDATFWEATSVVDIKVRGNTYCTGVLISTTKVLAPAHCLVGIWPTDITMRAGSIDRLSGGTIIDTVTDLTIHSLFNPATTPMTNNLSIITFSNPITPDSSIAIATLPTDDNDDFDGVTSSCFGWGRVSAGVSLPVILQKGELPILSETNANIQLASAPGALTITNDHVASRDPADGMTCGESSIQFVSLNGVPVLVGVGSYTFKNGGGGGIPIYPSISSRVSAFLNWINSN